MGDLVTQGPKVGTPGTSSLAQLRLLLVTFCLGLAGCGAVTVLVTSSDSDIEGLAPPVAAGAVVVVGVTGWLLAGRLGPRLNCDTAATLVASYRSRFFVRLALAEVAALTGFTVAILAYEPWPFFLGLAFTAVGFVRAAPTARNLARDQENLSVAGCAHPLAATLGAPATPASPAGPVS